MSLKKLDLISLYVEQIIKQWNSSSIQFILESRGSRDQQVFKKTTDVRSVNQSTMPFRTFIKTLPTGAIRNRHLKVVRVPNV